MKESGPVVSESIRDYETTLLAACSLVLIISSLVLMRELTEIGFQFVLYGQDGLSPDSVKDAIALGTITATQIAAIDTLPKD